MTDTIRQNYLSLAQLDTRLLALEGFVVTLAKTTPAFQCRSAFWRRVDPLICKIAADNRLFRVRLYNIAAQHTTNILTDPAYRREVIHARSTEGRNL